MSFIGVVGVVAQAAQAGSPPTSVSIATTSSGNYNNAFVVVETGGAAGITTAHLYDGSNHSYVSGSNAYTTTVNQDVADFDAFEGFDTSCYLAFRAYGRATNATSHAWTLSIVNDTTSGVTNSLVTSSSTAQDGTSGNGVAKWQMAFGGGRGGFTYPSNNEYIDLKLEYDATNSDGTTSATDCMIRYVYSA